VLLTPLWKIPKVRKGKSTLKPKLNDMRKVLAIIFSVFLISCNSHQSKNIYSEINQRDIHLKTKDSVLVTNFEHVKLLADSIFTLITKNDEMKNHVIVSYNFEYDNWIKEINDSLVGLPGIYWINYSLNLNNDTIPGGRIEIDSLRRIKHCNLFNLLGLKKLHEGELRITKETAKQISSQNGLKLETLQLEFKASKELDPICLNYKGFESLFSRTDLTKVAYFWDASNDCDQCPRIYINAKDGSVFERFKSIIRY
jgi:hypothetical protein